MGNFCSFRTNNNSSDTIDLIWSFLTKDNTQQTVYLINTRNIERYEVKRVANKLIMVDMLKDISYHLSVSNITATECTLTGKYSHNNAIHKRSFTFKLVNDTENNKNSLGWRTKVFVMERNLMIEFLLLF